MERCEGVGALLQLPGKEEVPSVHVLALGRGKGLFLRGKKILLQASGYVVGVAKVEILGEIDDLIKSLVAQLSDLAVGQAKADRALPTVPHGEEHGTRIPLPSSPPWPVGRLERERFGGLDGVDAVAAEASNLRPLGNERSVWGRGRQGDYELRRKGRSIRIWGRGPSAGERER